MLKNYLKVAFRYLLNNKRYAIINLVGLTLGFSCFLLLNLYVSSERSFDLQHEGVYRILQTQLDKGVEHETAIIGPRIGTAAKQQVPGIEAVTELLVSGRLTVGNDPANRQYEKLTTIDSSFFNLFKCKFVEGSIQSAFTQANGIIVTKSLAKKYFGNEPAFNKQLYTNIFPGIVAGVIEDFPGNTHLEGAMFMPTQTAEANFKWWKDFVSTNWHRNAAVTYVRVKPGADIASLNNKITELAKANWPKQEKFDSRFALQPVQDIHLYKGDVESEINKSKGNAFYVKMFFWVALIVLLVACFNYTGLLNVAFINRSKEIGVRKAIGAGRRQLLTQFLVETFLLTCTAMLLSAIILQLLKPFITQQLGSSFNWSYLSATTIIVLFLAGLFISILSISYPIYLISKLAPVVALKSQQKKQGNFSFQKSMLMLQFTIAIGLIACTALFYEQVHYMQVKERGFDSEGVIVVDINSGTLRKKFEAIKTSFKSLPEVKSVSVSSRVPGEWKNYPTVSVKKEGADKAVNDMLFIGADQDFIHAYSVKLLQGENFAGLLSDSTKVLINAAAAKALKLQQPVGQWITIPAANFGGDNTSLDVPFKAQVAGVVNDFHFEDFHKSIRPMVIGFWKNPVQTIDYYSLKVSTTDWSKTIAALQKINNSFDAENPLEYNILNDQLQRFSESDILRSKLLMFFTTVIVFIACLGLFAITVYVLKNRTKEIGIRKVFGATVTDLVKLVSVDFIKLVGLATLIAVPIAWWVMSVWLKEFAYRVSIQWYIFLGAAAIIGLIAFVTVGFQTIKTSLKNPVRSLRNE
jgi:putative ABC transport system permease protein